MKYTLLLIGLSFSHCIHPEGFIAGTLIKTEQGYVPIEELKEGDNVSSFDPRRIYTTSPVIQVVRKKTASLVKITIDDEVIFAAPDQRFLSATFHGGNSWIAAASIQPNSALGAHQIRDVETLEIETDVYILSVATYGNFIVSEHGICVHNFEPVSTLTACLATYTAVSTIAEFVCGAATAIAVVGLGGMAAGPMVAPSRHRTPARSYDSHNESYLYSDNSPSNSEAEGNNQPSCCAGGNNPGNPLDPNDPRNPKNKLQASLKKISDKQQKKLNQNPSANQQKEGLANLRCQLEKQTNIQLKKGAKSTAQQVIKHKIKLAEYLKNPDKYDNKGFLKNAKTTAERNNIIKTRADHLRDEIKMFEESIALRNKILRERGAL